VEEVVGILWMIFQPLLFGLIAAAVQIERLTAETVGMYVLHVEDLLVAAIRSNIIVLCEYV
jgi:hypothetical protein